MTPVDNKVANKPHIYFNREKNGWRFVPTYGANGDANIDVGLNLEANLFVCILHQNLAEYTRILSRYEYNHGHRKLTQIRNTWRVKKK